MEMVHVAISLGCTLGDLFFKLWLGDKSPLRELTKAATGLLEKRLDDEIERRKAGRFFADAGDQAARVITRALSAHGAGTDQETSDLILSLVTETFVRAGLTPKELVACGLSSDRVALYLRAYAPDAVASLTANDAQVYALILTEACECVVTTAAALPSYADHAFAGLLQNQERISHELKYRFDEMFRLLSSPSEQEHRYRRRVIAKLDRMKLYGMPGSWKAGYNLSIAYITLSVAGTGAPSGMPVTEALASSRRTVVRGLAGSGKTTLLQWLAVRVASGNLPAALGHWSDKLALFAPLREFAGTKLPALSALPAHLMQDACMPAGWVADRVGSTGSGALLLVDGVDELPDRQRSDVADWLTDLFDEYPALDCIVTTRPHALRRGELTHLGFSEADLQTMNQSDIDVFVSGWHAAVASRATTDDERRELTRLERDMLKILEDSRPIRLLASSPLLCALLCALHKDTGAALPQDRVGLYRRCCETLISRDALRNIDSNDYVQLGDNHKWLVLEDLALWMISNSLSEAPITRVDARIARRLQVDEVAGSRARALLVERCGILREPSAGVIDFPHRTFQEYLAAGAALDEDDIELLILHAHEESWREVVLLAAGRATRRGVADTMIEGLVSRALQEADNAHTLLLLAMECIGLAREASHRVRSSVTAHISLLVPPKNMSDAKRLAAAGEPAVQFLSYDPSLSENDCAACVRTLAHIGTESALDALVRYASDARPAVAAELFASVGYAPDRTSYAVRILPLLTIASIEARGDLYFRCALYVPTVERLVVAGVEFDKTKPDGSHVALSELQDLDMLRELTLKQCSLETFSRLCGIPSLRVLRLLAVTCANWDSLRGLDQLSDLLVTTGCGFSGRAARNVRVHLLSDGGGRGVDQLPPPSPQDQAQ